jgi:hypothetical protein
MLLAQRILGRDPALRIFFLVRDPALRIFFLVRDPALRIFFENSDPNTTRRPVPQNFFPVRCAEWRH